jgi:hypothetical protein
MSKNIRWYNFSKNPLDSISEESQIEELLGKDWGKGKAALARVEDEGHSNEGAIPTDSNDKKEEERRDGGGNSRSKALRWAQFQDQLG